ncbi:DUF2975 domain-containing protein [Flavobacterium limnophilum]|uniref:DUF2975 domain-containing protein n=1 Tax=Flavobacterium limnophilum TaxID=3003262 RepID=UPI002482AA81|nr:DUF2975 domain-containing protein [Flavobacterium limnophilum]
MKKLNILKTILDIFWFFSIIACIPVIIILTMYLFESVPDMSINFKGHKIINHNALNKTIVAINTISSFIFLYSIYTLRKVVILFKKREVFNPKIPQMLNLIGISVLTSSTISSVCFLIYQRVEGKNPGLSLDFGGYDSFLISVSIGLFFMVLSTIFKIIYSIKEENDLTV